MKKWWLIASAGLLFVALTLRNPFSDHHFLFNLEPYPDGLFYVVPALRLATGQSFSFTYQDLTVVKPSVLPFYSLVISLGYVISPVAQTFYGVNVLLGVLSVVGLGLLCKKIGWSWWSRAMVLLTYLLHLIIAWLPSVPMAENLGLPILIWAILGLLYLKDHPLWPIVTAVLIASLVFVKYTFIGPAVVLALFLLWRLDPRVAPKKLLKVFGVWLVLGIIFGWYQIQTGFNPFNVVTTLGQTSTVVSNTTFYALEYLPANAIAYLKMLGGVDTNFLWLRGPFTPGVLLLTILVGGWQSFRSQTTFKWVSLLLLLLFVAQFPVLLIFYVVDARYLILSLPLIALGVGLTLEVTQPKWLFSGLVIGSLLFFCLQQRQLAKSLIAANWLGRSEAWQYQAVKAADQVIPNDSYLITALPPFLFEIYSQHHYQTLPLSEAQEFLEKQQYVWPAVTDNQNLTTNYQTLLSAGKKIYVTKAYLTAETEFSEDFTTLQKNFNLKLIKEGCLQTCNIYQLETASTSAVTSAAEK